MSDIALFEKLTTEVDRNRLYDILLDPQFSTATAASKTITGYIDFLAEGLENEGGYTSEEAESLAAKTVFTGLSARFLGFDHQLERLNELGGLLIGSNGLSPTELLESAGSPTYTEFIGAFVHELAGDLDWLHDED